MAEKDDHNANPFAAPETDFGKADHNEPEDKVTYAEFGTRFVAALVDGIILWVLEFALGMVLAASLVATLGETQAKAVLIPAGYLLQIVVGWLYCALQESSGAQATLGKRLMKIKVVDLDGRRISFGRATGRHFGKILSAVILLIGYIMQQFTVKRQALHDIMAGTLVIRD